MSSPRDTQINPIEKLKELEEQLAKQQDHFIHDPAAQEQFRKQYADYVAQAAAELNDLSVYRFSQLDQLNIGSTDPRKIPETHATLIRSLNNLSYFVAHDILSNTDITQRTLATERWIAIMKSSVALGDFHTAIAINVGLDNTSVKRLVGTQNGLSKEAKKIKEEMDQLIPKNPDDKCTLFNNSSVPGSIVPLYVPYTGQIMLIEEDIDKANDDLKARLANENDPVKQEDINSRIGAHLQRLKDKKQELVDQLEKIHEGVASRNTRTSEDPLTLLQQSIESGVIQDMRENLTDDKLRQKVNEGQKGRLISEFKTKNIPINASTQAEFDRQVGLLAAKQLQTELDNRTEDRFFELSQKLEAKGGVNITPTTLLTNTTLSNAIVPDTRLKVDAGMEKYIALEKRIKEFQKYVIGEQGVGGIDETLGGLHQVRKAKYGHILDLMSTWTLEEQSAFIGGVLARPGDLAEHISISPLGKGETKGLTHLREIKEATDALINIRNEAKGLTNVTPLKSQAEYVEEASARAAAKKATSTKTPKTMWKEKMKIMQASSASLGDWRGLTEQYLKSSSGEGDALDEKRKQVLKGILEKIQENPNERISILNAAIRGRKYGSDDYSVLHQHHDSLHGRILKARSEDTTSVQLLKGLRQSDVNELINAEKKTLGSGQSTVAKEYATAFQELADVALHHPMGIHRRAAEGLMYDLMAINIDQVGGLNSKVVLLATAEETYKNNSVLHNIVSRLNDAINIRLPGRKQTVVQPSQTPRVDWKKYIKTLTDKDAKVDVWVKASKDYADEDVRTKWTGKGEDTLDSQRKQELDVVLNRYQQAEGPIQKLEFLNKVINGELYPNLAVHHARLQGGIKGANEDTSAIQLLKGLRGALVEPRLELSRTPGSFPLLKSLKQHIEALPNNKNKREAEQFFYELLTKQNEHDWQTHLNLSTEVFKNNPSLKDYRTGLLGFDPLQIRPRSQTAPERPVTPPVESPTSRRATEPAAKVVEQDNMVRDMVQHFNEFREAHHIAETILDRTHTMFTSGDFKELDAARKKMVGAIIHINEERKTLGMESPSVNERLQHIQQQYNEIIERRDSFSMNPRAGSPGSRGMFSGHAEHHADKKEEDNGESESPHEKPQ